ncbi:MAG: hypothetical protein AAGF85_16615 [Bacteroidota bacterium]
MSKRGSLNELVHSLEKSEKRYLSLFTNLQSGDKYYLNLFKAIEKGDPEDIEVNGGSALAVTKNYLGKLILKSLKSFTEGRTKHSELLHLLLEIEILFQKELYDLCQTKIKKGKTIAAKYESFNILLELLHWEKRVINSLPKSGNREAVKEVVRREGEVLEKLNNLHQYSAFVEELMTSDLLDLKKMERYQEHSLLKNASCAKSFGAFILYYHLKYILFTVTNNSSEGRKVLAELIVLMEERPHRIKENPEGYLTTLHNLMGMMLYNKETHEALGVLNKIREIPEKYGLKKQSYILRMFVKTYNVELELYRDLRDWGRALELMSEINRLIETYVVPNNYLLSFYYQFGYIHFQLGEYSESLMSINKILNTNFGDERSDLQTYARFLFLMIHFELGNITLLRYAVDNTRRFLKKRRGALFPFEKELLKFFSKLSMSPAHRYPSLFERLSASLFRHHTDDQRSNILDYLDFESWLEKRLDKSLT